MKKLLVIVAIAVIALPSCKKKYTCCCDLLGTQICAENTVKQTKKDAVASCETASAGLCKLQ